MGDSRRGGAHLPGPGRPGTTGRTTTVRLGRICQGRRDWAAAADAYRRALEAIGLDPADAAGGRVPPRRGGAVRRVPGHRGAGGVPGGAGPAGAGGPLLRRAARLHAEQPPAEHRLRAPVPGQGATWPPPSRPSPWPPRQCCGPCVVEVEAGLAEVLERQGQSGSGLRALPSGALQGAAGRGAAGAGGAAGARAGRRRGDGGHLPPLPGPPAGPRGGAAGAGALCERMGLGQEAAELKERAALLSSIAEPAGTARGEGRRA